MTKSSRAVAEQKARRALELRYAGATYVEIAQQVGFKHWQSAARVVQQELRKLRITDEDLDNFKTLQMHRYGRMLTTQWPAVNRGDPDAIATALRIMSAMERLAGTAGIMDREIYGGVTVNVGPNAGGQVVIDGDHAEYIAKLNSMAKRMGLPEVEGDQAHLDAIDVASKELAAGNGHQKALSHAGNGHTAPQPAGSYLDSPQPNDQPPDYEQVFASGQPDTEVICTGFIRPVTGADECKRCKQSKAQHTRD